MRDINGIGKLRNVAIATILCAGVVCPTYVATAAENQAAATAAQPSSPSSSGSGDFSIGKVFDNEESANDVDKTETVYVFTTADGTPKSTTVTNWLKNPGKADAIDDRTSLTDLENTGGSQPFTQAGDATTWQARGSDIHYKGRTTATAPVSVKITYVLDGIETTPQEIAGKSGHVKIRYEFANSSASTAVIDGKETTIYTPFTCLTGMILDNDNFKNITGTNAKIINDGDRTTVAGYAFPGMKENLDVDDGDADLPSSFEVEADVTGFELATTATIVTPGLLNSLNPDAMDSGSIEDDLNSLSDAMTQLENGSGELYDGLVQLADGAGQLDAGIGTLRDSAAALPDSTRALADGSAALTSGLAQLSSGSGQLLEVARQVDGGAKLLAEGEDGAGGLKAAKDGAAQLKGGADGLAQGIGQLSAAIGEADPSNDDTDTLYRALNTAKSSLAGTDPGKIKSALESLKYAGDKLAELSGKCQEAETSLNDIATSLGSVDFTEAVAALDAAQADIDASGYSHVNDAVDALDSINASGLSAADKELLDKAKSELRNVDTDKLDSAEKRISTAKDSLASAGAGIAALKADIEAEAAHFKAAATQLKENAEQLRAIYSNAVPSATGYAAAQQCVEGALDGLAKTKQGLDGASMGAKDLAAGAESLDSGLGEAVDGITALRKGTNALVVNLGPLAAGAQNAQTGSSRLASGLQQLNEASPALVAGIAALKEGSTALSDGTSSAANGSGQLTDGIRQLDEQAIGKIISLYNDDVKGLSGRLRATVQAGRDYQTFSGKADGATGDVKFIFETDAIKNG